MRNPTVPKNSYIDAVPQDTQPGDVICVLFGCSVPVVLRKAATAEAHDPDDDSYAFIGEAYLYGLMDAEAIVLLKKGTREVQDFVLH